MAIDLTHLSKVISHALRHEPWLYALELDEEGWVPVEELLAALRAHSRRFQGVTRAEIEEMMRRSSKQRFELEGERIRALYGHSLPERIQKEPAAPPEILYHGTPPPAAQKILREGLKPMARQYVHLSVDVETARQVGRRRSPTPVLLRVRSGEAHRRGVRFYEGNPQTWLADAVPPEFIETD